MLNFSREEKDLFEFTCIMFSCSDADGHSLQLVPILLSVLSIFFFFFFFFFFFMSYEHYLCLGKRFSASKIDFNP